MPEPFAVTLAAVISLALWTRRHDIITVAMLLLWDWGLCVALATVDGVGNNWFGNFCIDFGTAMLLLMWHTRRWQLVVFAIFIGMIACHFGYGFIGSKRWSDHYYFSALSALSWIQVAYVGWKGIADVAERSGFGDRIFRGPLSGNAPNRGLGPERYDP